MITKTTLLVTICTFLNSFVIAQTQTFGLFLLSNQSNTGINNIVKTEKISPKVTNQQAVQLSLKAELFPNPSNLGNVRLLITNLPDEPVYIQIFDGNNYLIQEGEINGTLGASLQHTLKLPDTTGTYYIKLSDSNKILQNLELNIL